MPGEVNEANGKKENLITEEKNTDIPNIHNEEQNIQKVEHNELEGEEYNVKEGGGGEM